MNGIPETIELKMKNVNIDFMMFKLLKNVKNQHAYILYSCRYDVNKL